MIRSNSYWRLCMFPVRKNSLFPTLACSKYASDSLRYGAQYAGFQFGALRYGAVNEVGLHFGDESVCSSFSWTPVWHPTLWCCQFSVLARTRPTLACSLVVLNGQASVGFPGWKNPTLQTEKWVYLQWGLSAKLTLRKPRDENATFISACLQVIECILQVPRGLINQAAFPKQ